MAYNPYYPVTYQPYNGYYPQSYQAMAQPQIMQQPNQVTQNQATSGIIWVSGLAEAQAFPVVANSAVALWEQSGKTIFLKSADSTGKPSIKVYDLVERTDSLSPASGTQEGKTVNYAVKDDVVALAGAVKSIMNDIEQMKGDLYGVAGRKKNVKKPEVEDDDA